MKVLRIEMEVPTDGVVYFSDLKNAFGDSNITTVFAGDFYTNSYKEFTKNVTGIPSSGTLFTLTPFRGKKRTVTTFLSNGNDVYTYTIPVKHIDEIPYSTFSGITANKFYLNYNLYTATGVITPICVACRKSPNKSKITQSAFTLNGTTFSIGSPSSYSPFSLDDYDNLFMDGEGAGYLSTTDSYGIGTMTHYRLTMNNDVFSVTSTNATPQGFQTFYDIGSIVAFPKTARTLYFTTSQYRLNDGTWKTWPSNVSTLLTNLSSNLPMNYLTTVSDGVNSVLIIYGNSSSGVYVTFDLTTQTVLTSTDVSFFDTFIWYNTTEQDAIGNQLFAIDGAMAFYRDTAFYYTTDATADYAFIDYVAPVNSSSFGVRNTQTGMDVMTIIDSADKRVVFADWGHDNGGLFNFGNDDTLGYAKTNIYLINNPVSLEIGTPIGGPPATLPYTFTSHTFTPAGATGRTGPLLTAVRSAYSNAGSWVNTFINMTTQGIQEWTVPTTGSYKIEAAGAQGGDCGSFLGGRGRIVELTVSLNQGDVVHILVGQQGTTGSVVSEFGAGGGGASFVVKNGSYLLIAGGGGGASSGSYASTGNNAPYSASIGDGNGGQRYYSTSIGGGGAGWNGNGADGEVGGIWSNTGGRSFANGGLGGAALGGAQYSRVGSGDGGFGGGGAMAHDNVPRSGGGGGYTGGYGGVVTWPSQIPSNGGTHAPANAIDRGTRSGDGYVIVTKL